MLFWIPHVIPRAEAQSPRTAAFSAIGRLKRGVSPAQAQAEGTAAAPLILLPVAAAACLLPALRAASTDPAAALRGE